MISFNSVSKIYKGRPAIDDISFRIQDKEFISIVGRSGAGKSTILKLLLREEDPTSGTISFKGVDIGMLRGKSVANYRRRIGTVFQDFKLLNSKTVFENVAFAMEAAAQPQEDIDRDVPQVLAIVGLEDKGENFPQELSGGEKQRVSLARALVQRPEIILADEPTGNLDPVHTWDIVKLLVQINEYGTAVVIATHDRDIVNFLKRRVITLENGKIVRDEAKGKYHL